MKVIVDISDSIIQELIRKNNLEIKKPIIDTRPVNIKGLSLMADSKLNLSLFKEVKTE
jgi:hypothetical protein